MTEKLNGIERALHIAGGHPMDLAYKTRISLKTIYRYLSKGGVATTVHAKRIADLTGVPMEQLVPTVAGGNDQPRRIKARKGVAVRRTCGSKPPFLSPVRASLAS